MSIWTRMRNLVRRNELNREIDEELDSHIAEAIEQGRDPVEARRAFGSPLRTREESRDVNLFAWLDSLRADAALGLRRLAKNKVTSAAAILSLALAIGSCMAAFRIIDAVLWRPLPIAAPERLHVLSREFVDASGKPVTGDNFEYPLFRQMRAVVKDQSELIAVSNADRIDITYARDSETERAYQQYVSGWMFESFGIRPALGRVFTESDDLTPGAHPYAVLSYNYWKRRFASDPAVLGRTFRNGNNVYQIIGVAEGPFVGTEPGTVTDIFIPTMMMKNNAISRSDYQWFRTFAQLKPGANASQVLEKLRPTFQAFEEERAKVSVGGTKRGERLTVNSASTGASWMQTEYRTAFAVLGVLVMLVLLISCANVANLMTAQAAARQREMALRVSIGAGRLRLIQLVVIECAWLASFAVCLGACFAWWTAPWIVGMIGTADNPARLILPADWRVLGFGVAMAFGVTILFGLTPALRASGVKPAAALKGGEPSARSRLMRASIVAQVAFCVLVLFVAGLFVKTSTRLSHQQTGFSSERLLAVEVVTPQAQPEPAWEQIAAQLRTEPGVASVAISEWPLMAGGSWNGFIAVNGASPDRIASYFLTVSPEWRDVMKIPLLQGRDFHADETLPGAVLVNDAFAKQYFAGENPVGKFFDVVANEGSHARHQIVGIVGNARYRDMREPLRPTTYFPFSQRYGRATFMIRTSNQNPMAIASAMRLDVPRARAGFRVSNILTQTALIEQHTVRERLLAMLALFFGAVALSLAAVGIYGVLHYSVQQRRREIGIRIAIGAQPYDIARLVTTDVVAMVFTGAISGIALGMASVKYVESLFYQVKATDASMLALPFVTILVAALLAALPVIIRAVRIDPVAMLRAE